MDRITHQSPRQRGYGSTSSLRNDSLKHTRKHEKGREESNQEAKLTGSGGPSGQEGRTVRTSLADRPAWSRGPSAPTLRTVRPYTTREVAICDDLLVTLLILVTKWYVFHDEMYVFVISCKWRWFEWKNNDENEFFVTKQQKENVIDYVLVRRMVMMKWFGHKLYLISS
jgi:hypothetical protein